MATKTKTAEVKLGTYKDVDIYFSAFEGLAAQTFSATLPLALGRLLLSSASLDYLKKQIAKALREKEDIMDVGGIPVVVLTYPRNKNGSISRSTAGRKWYFGHVVRRHDTGRQKHGRRIYDYAIKVPGWKKPWELTHYNCSAYTLRLAPAAKTLALGKATATTLNRLDEKRQKADIDYTQFKGKLPSVERLTTSQLIKRTAKARK